MRNRRGIAAPTPSHESRQAAAGASSRKPGKLTRDGRRSGGAPPRRSAPPPPRKVMDDVEANAGDRLRRTASAREQAVERSIQRHERRERGRGDSRPAGDRSGDGGDRERRAETMPPGEVELGRRMPLPGEQTDPWDAAVEDVGTHHVHEAPRLEVRALELGVEPNPRAARCQPGTELDVLDRRPRIPVGVETPGVEEQLATNGAEPRPEAAHGPAALWWT